MEGVLRWPRRHGTVVAGQRRGGRSGESERSDAAAHIACFRGRHVDAALLLLDKGAEIDRAFGGRRTPLLMACVEGHVDAVRLLLDKGAEVDRATKDGRRRCTSPAGMATSTRRGCC